MTHVLVSIIVPVYNVEKYIDQCIESIIDQRYEKIEILLIDDGSTDSSGIICDHYAQIDSRIRVIHKKNGGLSSAIKAGLKLALGKYICFVDSDDWIENNYVYKMLKIAVKYKCDLVCANAFLNGKEQTVYEMHHCEEGLYNKEKIVNNIFPSLIVKMDEKGIRVAPARWGKLFLKDTIMNNLAYYNENVQLGEDVLLTLPYLLACNSLYILKDCLYHYRINDNSISHSFKTKNLDDLLVVFESECKFVKHISDYNFETQLEAKKVEIISRTIGEIGLNLNSKEEKRKAYSYLKKVLCNTFSEYSTHPWTKSKKEKIKFFLIMKKNFRIIWILMVLNRKISNFEK